VTRTLTKYVNLETLLSRGESAIIVVKLMMASNDLSLANDALGQWKKERQLSRKARQTGAGMYFVRTQLAHLYEGLKVIEEIREDSSLLAKVKNCGIQTQESFQNLEQFLPGGLKRLELIKLVGKVRHNLTFHYNQSSELIRRAISDRAARSEARHSSITSSDTAYLWYFKVADDIVDSIVVRQIWEIPKSADPRVEADKVADYVHQIFVSFMDFSTMFIWKYFEDWRL
jgi:hypothetical protein